MRFKLNGVETIFDGDPDLKLQEYLKSVEDIHVPRIGYSGGGICGAAVRELQSPSLLFKIPCGLPQGASLIFCGFKP